MSVNVNPLIVPCPICGSEAGAVCRDDLDPTRKVRPHAARRTTAERWQAAERLRLTEREDERRATRVRLYRLLGHSPAMANRLAGARKRRAGQAS